MTTAREEYSALQKRVEELCVGDRTLLPGKTVFKVIGDVFVDGFVFTDGTYACTSSTTDSDEVFFPQPYHNLDYMPTAEKIGLVSTEYYQDLWKRIHAEDSAGREASNKARRLARYKKLLEFKKNGVF